MFAVRANAQGICSGVWIWGAATTFNVPCGIQSYKNVALLIWCCIIGVAIVINTTLLLLLLSRQLHVVKFWSVLFERHTRSEHHFHEGVLATVGYAAQDAFWL